MLIIYAPFVKETALAMNKISEKYSQQFRQDSVLVAITPATLGMKFILE
jgi:hypothetical protein